MKSNLMTLIAVMIISAAGYSQTKSLTDSKVGLGYENQKYEVALFVGLASYDGDLLSYSDDNIGILSEASFATGVSFRKNMSDHFRVSLNYMTAKVSGSDALFSQGSGHPGRGFSFTNRLNEITVGLDYAPFAHKSWKVMPFVSVGMGAVFGNVKTEYRKTSQPAELQTRIDQDIKDQASTSFTLPVGFGIKAKLSQNISIQADAALRFAVNDFIDGASNSASTKHSDYYGMGGISIGYSFGGVAANNRSIKEF